jgi:predicted dithiol-disulfide oxidoreductase (DUF899 family)
VCITSSIHQFINHQSSSLYNMTTEIQRHPDGASPEYIKARTELLTAEWELRDQIEKVAALRRQLPPGVVMQDYVFDGPNNTRISLQDLAADGRTLVIYHLMFSEKDKNPCSMCGMFVDGQNGLGKHLDQLVNYFVVAKAPYQQIEEYANNRGWKNLHFLSSAGNTFNKDMQVECPAWSPDQYTLPGISVFKKDDTGKLRHVYSQTAQFDPDTYRGMDLLAPVYNVLDLVPEGRGNW